MALIKCAECGKEISDTAEKCPNCGCKTKHGTTVTEAKSTVVVAIIIMSMAAIGCLLFLFSWFDIIDYGFDFFIDWIEDEDLRPVMFKFIIGLSLVVGSIVGGRKLKEAQDKSKYSTNDSNKSNFFNSSNHQSSTSGSHPSTGSEYVPAWKRVEQNEDQ